MYKRDRRYYNFIIYILIFSMALTVGAAPSLAYTAPVGEADQADQYAALFEKWSRLTYFDHFPTRTINLTGSVTMGQFAFFTVKFMRWDLSAVQGVRPDFSVYENSYKYLTDINVMQPAADMPATAIAADMPVTALEAARILNSAFSLNTAGMGSLDSLIKNPGDVPKADWPAVAFLVENGVIKTNAEGRFPASRFMSFYDMMAALDTLTALLGDDPRKGVTYNNRYGPDITCVRFYHDLIDGITREDRLIFENDKLRESYTKSRAIINRVIENTGADAAAYDVALALHDELILMASYDNNISGKLAGDDCYSPYGVLVLNAGGCESYSRAYRILLTMGGIENMLIYGAADGVPHMWNLIALDGDYYHVDVTWDDPVPDRPGKTAYQYFCLSDDMISVSHDWDRERYPACTATEYNYYYHNKLAFVSSNDALEFCKTAFSKRQEAVRIRITGMKPGKAQVFIRAIGPYINGYGVKSLLFYETQDFIDIYPTYT